MSLELQYPTCRQLLHDGRYCPCPALRDRSFCRHHTDERQRQRNLAKARQLKDYTQSKRLAANPNLRPEEELNGAIFDSIGFPTLDTSAAICVATSNVARLLGAGHLSPRAAAVMAKLIRIAEVNLRQGQVILPAALPTPPVNDTSRDSQCETRNELLHSDPVPALGDANSEASAPSAETGNPLDSVPAFGDDEGFVLPEETNLKRIHEQAKGDIGADFVNESRAALGNMPALIDELDPKYAHLPPMERGRAAYRDLKRLQSCAGGSTPLQRSGSPTTKIGASAPENGTPDSSSPLNESRGSLGMTNEAGTHDARLKPCSSPDNPRSKAGPAPDPREEVKAS